MGIKDKLFGKSKDKVDNEEDITSEITKDESIEMNHDVHISYSSKDMKEAQMVCHILEHNSIKCWIAPRDLVHNQPFQEIINDAVRKSKVVVLILSKNTPISPYVLREIKEAFDKQIPIIPFIISDIGSYDLDNELGFYLKGYQFVGSDNPEDNYEELVKEVLDIRNKHNLSESDPLPPYNGEDKYIFISHVSDDSDEVFPDIRKFQDMGYNVWYDDGKIANGEKKKKIRVGHLKRSDLCIVFVTNASMASIQIQKEIKYAVKHNKNMIPIYLEDFDSIEMEDDIDFELSVIQGILKTTLDEEEYVFKFTEAFEKFGFKFSKK